MNAHEPECPMRECPLVGTIPCDGDTSCNRTQVINGADERCGAICICNELRACRERALNEATAAVMDLPTWWDESDTPSNVEGERDACWHDEVLAAIDNLRGA